MFDPAIATVQAATPIGILVVDDQRAVREGLAKLIAAAPLALRFVSTAATAQEALSAAARLHPDVVVLDVDLAGEDGLLLVVNLPPGTGVLVLTSHGDTVTRKRAKALGVGAFIEKHQPAADLLNAITDLCRQRERGGKPPGTPGASSHHEMATNSDARQHSGH
jgi:two-component system nitrate/nitrite response regulator NarL